MALLVDCGPIAVGFWRQGENHLGGVNRGVQHRLAFGRAVLLGVVKLAQQIHFALGIPGDAFPAVADGFQQRADGGEAMKMALPQGVWGLSQGLLGRARAMIMRAV